uniref:Uncharacterized protein n=1 Tax=Physcomitrium patens TaxID=3218 RepID=A0A2K1IJ33_PHYPA|nr:hypothetical protein PHYPA_027979 [Physcomitrium patens]
MRGVGSKVSDPWGYVGGMLPCGFKGQGKEAEKSEGSFIGPSMQQNALLLIHGEREKEVQVLVSETNGYSALKKFCRLSQMVTLVSESVSSGFPQHLLHACDLILS